jgi:integrase
MASIRNRDGRWQARVIRQGYPEQTKTFDTKADAERWARLIENEQDRGEFYDRLLAEKTTLGDILKRYAQQVTPLKRGHKSELQRLSKMQRDQLAKLSLANLRPQDLADYRDRRVQTIMSSTANRELQLISAVINHARREWGIGMRDNPVSQIRKPPLGQGRSRLFVGDEEERLFAAMRGDWGYKRKPKKTFNHWTLPITQLALETACRRGELLSMTWENVDLSRAVVFLPMTKNGESRAVPLSSKAIEIIRSLPKTDDPQLFPIPWTALHQSFSRACKRAGVEGFHFHDLRHVATTRMAKRLPNVIELAAVTGHKSLSMLHRYYHTRAEDLARKLG